MNVNLKVNGIQKPVQTMQIDYISPQLNPGTQLLTIRGKVENPSGDLQPGMQAVVLLPSATVNNAIRLPLEAVIRSAEGAHIWIKNGKNTFTPRNVVTGAEDARAIVITSGLKGGEEVVISGAYLLYSEFVLKKGADPLTAHQHK
jgi:Cu(I)/Ag(I) efflux system membrane fusion protein